MVTDLKSNYAARTHFRGYAIPGPAAPGLEAHPDLLPGPDETLDALCGHYRIFQLRRGHRFSTDDILVAWYGTSWCPTARRILDLGSGLGTVAMVAAWRLAGTRLVTVEAQPESVALARKSIRWNGLEDRFDVREGDFRGAGVIGPDERFDLVFGSPPYFPIGTGVLGDHPQKVACRFELRGDIEDYCRKAADSLQTGGLFACVFPLTPAHQSERVEAAAKGAGLTIVRQRPVVLREGEPPLLGLYGMMRCVDLPADIHHRVWEEPSLVIRCADGAVHPEYQAIKLAFGFPP